MSWSLLLLKQVPKNWTTELPANDPTQWAQIFRFHSLTMDKGVAKNTPLDNNEFINDIKAGNYPNKGIRGTIIQLEEWEKDINAWRSLPAITSLVSGKEPVTRPANLRTIISRFVKEVLPVLKKNLKEIDVKRTKGTQYKRKTDWNNTESIIEALTGINDKDEKEQRELLDEFNTNTRDKVKVNEKLKNWGTKNNIPTLLRTLGYNNRVTLQIERNQPSYTRDKKGFKRKYEKMNEAQWGRIRLEPLTINGDTIEFTKTPNNITSTSFNKDNFTKINNAIDEKLRVKLKIKSIPIPLVKLFGYITWTKLTPTSDRLSQSALITQEQKDFERYKINPAFDFSHAQYFYRSVLKSKSKLVPENLKKLTLLRDPLLIKLLSKEYSNKKVYTAFMEDSKKQLFSDEKVLEAHYVKQIIESRGKGFESIDGESNSTKLTGSELDYFKSLNKKEQERYLINAMNDPDSNLYGILNNQIEEDVDNITSYLPYVVNEVEIEFINKLDNYTKTMETIQEEGIERGTDLFEPLRPLFNTQVKTKNELKIIDKSPKGILDDFISDIRMLNSLREVRGVFGKTHSRMINRLRFTPPKEDIQLPDLSNDDKFTGLNAEQRDIAEIVSLAYSAKQSFKDALTISDTYRKNSFQDILSVITKIGRKYTTKLTGMNPNTYVAIIEDLNFNKKKDYSAGSKGWEETKKTIKELVDALDRDIPIIRNFLKEEAEDMIKDVLKNSVTYLERETKVKAKKGKTKGTTRLLSKLKNNGLIVEDK
tara:strand:- start:2310 stop:4598 length:2289 start_codon:yes stop_codon:yes gene_type:complete